MANPNVFGFSLEQLRPVVERMARGGVSSLAIEECTSLEGGSRGDKLVVQFRFIDSAGTDRRMKSFVKRQPEDAVDHQGNPSPGEKHHYEYLCANGAPVVELYRAAVSPEPPTTEVLFLEYLDEVVTEDEPWEELQTDERHYTSYLRTLGKMAAFRPTGAYATGLRKPHAHFECQMRPWKDLYEDIWHYATPGSLGKTVKALCTEKNRARLRNLEQRVRTELAKAPSGFSMGDHEPMQSGRRSDGEVVLFDVEFVGYAPRFYDVSITLGAPESYCPRCAKAADLAEVFLKEYHRHGGDRVPVEQLLKETRTHWIAWVMGFIQFAYIKPELGQVVEADLLARKLECLLREAGG